MDEEWRGWTIRWAKEGSWVVATCELLPPAPSSLNKEEMVLMMLFMTL
jgi:hypothetical protein